MNDKARMSRRRALQAGAAAGVGAAAWSSPSLRKLGMAPASADHVSGHIVFSTSGNKINASNNGPCTNWDTGGGQQQNYSVPGTGGQISITLSPKPTCLTVGGSATIVTQPSGWTCVFVQSVAECSTGTVTNATGAGTTTVAIGACSGSPNPSSKLYFDLECNQN